MSRSSTVALVAATAAGRALVARLDAGLANTTAVVDHGSAAGSLRGAFDEHAAVVAVLAAGAVVRILAPQIAAGDKATDPAVLVIDEAGRFVTPLLGGHAAGANRLATQIAGVLGAQAVLSTATDAAGLPGLDDLGWPVTGDVAAVTRRLLDGEQVVVTSEQRWPLPALGANVRHELGGASGDVVITDRPVDAAPGTVVLHPPSLVAGMGASRGVSADEAERLLRRALDDAGLAPGSLAAITSADLKADEAGLVEVARRLGLPFITHTAEALGAVAVPNPSETVRAAVGIPSVAEAAAVLGAGHTSLGRLVVAKTASTMATVAIARHAPRGRLAIVGIGPGAPELLTPLAAAELRRAEVVVGLDQYVEQIRGLLRPGTTVLESGLGREEERAREAREQAARGRAVALIGSGDAGVYAMASPTLEGADAGIDVVGVPGVTAGLAASAVLGAPLGHDHCYLSLSDLHTPWEAIERRVRAVADADLVLLCYNPRSVKRDWQLGRALELLAPHRPGSTPIGVVRNASRPDESSWITTLDAFDAELVDMYCIVIVGSSQTKIVGGRMVTPRGYRWQYEEDGG
ncbi:precorrin-3B C(17)-methyltransferase [uncultured Jatrophihabitans sp.]|uniref:precorrin-3B C(17)-methyltransferase n=1 Tax=uncultured Jatrophihabitans sp. TaxID=1610747 RepID=UPI0035CC052F